MTEGGSPWDDPAVDVGFRAAYEPYVPRQSPAVLVEDALRADDPKPAASAAATAAAMAAARPLTRDVRRPRSEQPGRLSPSRALAGAAVSVAGVALGVVTLLWISDDPSQGPGPVVIDPVAGGEGVVDPFATKPEGETAPVAPPVAEPAPVAPPVAEPAPVAPSVVVPVTVLNNSRITGLADRGAAQFETAGWPVAETGNYRGRIRATTVYYPAGLMASAREFASRFAGVERVLPRPANLPGSGLTVVLTRDFSS